MSSVALTVKAYARRAFARVDPDQREELEASAVALAWKYAVRLAQRGRCPAECAGPLACWSVRHAWAGRRIDRGPRVRSVPARASGGDVGALVIGELVCKRTGPAEQTQFTLDAGEWLGGLPDARRELVLSLAAGERSSEAAARLNLSRARISQLRRELAESYASHCDL